ncbi:MAG: SH3 domain-containing protein [Actinomycetota bacterium]
MNSVRKNQPYPGGIGDARSRLLGALVVLILLAAGCGIADDKGVLTSAEVDDTEAANAADGDGSAASAPAGPSTSIADASAEDPDGSDPEDTTTTVPDTTVPSTADNSDGTDPASDDDDGLPGEPIDLFADEGDVLGVVGVTDDDVLNVRANPGTDQDVLTTVGPTSADLVSTGRARSLPDSIWYEVSVGGSTGWVSSSFVAFIGGTDDATADFLAENDGGLVSAQTMSDLGQLVAEQFASEEPPSRIVQTVGPVVGDLGEVTYDVIGIGDDSVLGFRLHVFATVVNDGATFTVRTIERTLLCTRGLSGELCV